MGTYCWITEGLKKPGKTQAGLAAALGRAPQTVTQLLKGQRELKVSEVPKIAEYLEVIPPFEGTVKIVGRTGETPDGNIKFATKKSCGEAPMPPGGRSDTVAIEAHGDSVRGIAPDGSLIYYEDRHEPPTPEMLGELCVIGLDDGRTLIKYLHRGRGEGLYDLESGFLPTLRDVRVVWASLVTAIIPGAQARKLICRENSPATPVSRQKR